MSPILIVLLAIAGFLILIGLLFIFGIVRVRILYTDRVKVTVSVIGIRFTVYDSKKEEKKKEPKSFERCRNPERALKRELRRQKRLAKKARKRALAKAKKKAEKRAREIGEPKPNLRENLSMILALVKEIGSATKNNLKANVRSLRIRVATGDAAQTAILYGVTVQTVSYLIGFLETNFIELEREDGDMQVIADYVADKPSADIDLVFSVRIIRGLNLFNAVRRAIRKEKETAREKAKKRCA